jgi:hypothetical protein
MKTALICSLMALSSQAVAANECLPLAGFTLCGEWTAQDDLWAVTGDATIETMGISLSLPAASLTVSLDPPAFIGEVDFVLPSFGALEGWGVKGLTAPRAQIQMGMGAGLNEVEIGGEPLELVDDAPYLVFDIDSNVTLGVGRASLSASVGPSTKVIVAPLDPLIYLEGDVVERLTHGIVSDGAVGVSLNGMLPWSSSRSLFDGDGWDHRDVSAHLYASGGVQLGQYPVYVSSTVAIDLDPDDDGDVEFSLRQSDEVRVGVNGELAIGWSKNGVSLTLPIGEGSAVFDTYEDVLMVHGELDMNPFTGTPLEPLFTGVRGGTIWGHYEALNDFTVHVETDAPVMGFPASEVEMTLTNDGITFGGLLEPTYGDVFGDQSVRFTGSLNGQGKFRLDGTANLNLGGLPLANADLTWTNSGLTVRGWVEVPGGVGEALVEGSLQTNGQFSLTGRTDFSPLGLPMAASTVTMTNSGVTVTGRMEIPSLGDVDVVGAVHTNGTFVLSGAADLEVYGLELSSAEITVRDSGIAVAGRLKMPGLSRVRVHGSVGTDGDFSLSGDADLSVKGFELAAAHVEFGRGGVSIDGRIDALIAEGRVTGSYRTAASVAHLMGLSVEAYTTLKQFWIAQVGYSPMPREGVYLSGDMAIRISVPGPDIHLANGRISVSDSGMRAKGKVGFHGVNVQVSGSVTTSGSVSLKGDAGFDASVGGTGVKGDLTVTATDTKLSGKVSAKACVNVYIDEVCKSASASVSSTGRVSLNMPSPVPDISFNIASVF